MISVPQVSLGSSTATNLSLSPSPLRPPSRLSVSPSGIPVWQLHRVVSCSQVVLRSVRIRCPDYYMRSSILKNLGGLNMKVRTVVRDTRGTRTRTHTHTHTHTHTLSPSLSLSLSLSLRVCAGVCVCLPVFPRLCPSLSVTFPILYACKTLPTVYPM
jgi:hypothetical protein